MLTFPYDSTQSTFQYYEHWSVAVKLLDRHQHDFFLLTIHRCYLPQQSLIISFWRATNCLVNRLGCLGFSLEAPLTNNLIKCNSFLGLDVSLGGKRCQVGALSSLLFGGSIYISFMCVYESFPHNPSNAP